jgi:16S rRNA (guanine966-N2)-methyltransferase
VRITGGRFRSRALKAPRGTATRPTSDRVREALFGALDARGRVTGARVLDLYAGTGALGLEALSRGAAHVTFVERGRAALEALRANVEALGVQAATAIVRGAVDGAEGRVRGPFDLVFADPPYADVGSGVVARSLARFVGALSPDAVVVVEHASADAPPAVAGLALHDSRRYGDTTLTLYTRAPGHAPGHAPGQVREG